MSGRNSILAIGIFLCFFPGCSQKVCPAFESFYLLDEKTREQRFSYFQDSIPRTDISNVNKNRYGIIQEPFLAGIVNKIPPPIHSPFAKLNTIEPEIIYPELPDSLEFAGDELMAAELDIPDSTVFETDTTAVSKNWHFNVEQENYFNYLLKKLEIPIVPVTKEEEGTVQDQLSTSEADSLGVDSSKEKKGFLKNLFKRKDKGEQEADTTQQNTPGQN